MSGIGATGGLPPVLEAFDWFGFAVANLGDVDANGVVDLAVGAYGDDGPVKGNKGAVHLLMMQADGTVRSHYELGMEVTQLVNLVANALVIPEKVVIPAEEVPVEVEALPLAGRTLLVADDEHLVASGIASSLREMGYTVAGPVANGEEAIQLAETARPDMALLDIRMPKKDGLAAVTYEGKMIDYAMYKKAKVLLADAG